MGSQEKSLSRGSQYPLHLGFHEKLHREDLNLKTGKRNTTKNRVERGDHLNPEQKGGKVLGKASVCVCVCGYIRLARFLPVVLTRRAIEQAR